MNSLEKLAKFQAEMGDNPPEDEETARLMQFAGIAAPIIGPMLPEDPAELDGHILQLASWLLRQRSDETELPAAVAVQKDGAWIVETLPAPEASS